MTYLLDVNVLIALIDPAHVASNAAHAWFEHTGHESWATCPITENGILRILSNPRYPNSPRAPAAIAAILLELRGLAGHRFWPDDLSLAGSELVDPSRMLTAGHVTDTYLLALATSKNGRLATFDRRLSTGAVRGGKAALHVIPGG